MFRMLTLAALATSTAAFAGDESPEAAKAPATETTETAKVDTATTQKFETLDVDKDKKLSLVEVAAVADLNASFMTVDTDEDGALSRSEYDAWNELKIKGEKSAKKAEKTKSE